ncbi:MAG: hypothetical protein WEF50_16960 [Myxococcota bacterium]
MSVRAVPIARSAPPELHALIASNARLWAAEAEVFSVYFASPKRSAASDEVWLARQCFKELVDGVVGRFTQLTAGETDFARTRSAAQSALGDDVVRVELGHYVAFAIAHQASRRERAGPVVASARIGADWPENAELQNLRARQRLEFGALGSRASAFTEGGYCTLYSAGIALPRATPRDHAIAEACAQVFDDEWKHMLEGIAGLAEAPLDAADWKVLEDLTLAQGRCRIRMRNAQFGSPLAESRLRELEAGAAEPLAFDYVRAALLPPWDSR